MTNSIREQINSLQQQEAEQSVTTAAHSDPFPLAAQLQEYEASCRAFIVDLLSKMFDEQIASCVDTNIRTVKDKGNRNGFREYYITLIRNNRTVMLVLSVADDPMPSLPSLLGGLDNSERDHTYRWYGQVQSRMLVDPASIERLLTKPDMYRILRPLYDA